ncbi:11913_t:CDS:2 [Funneliformis geosporum]|uniref:8182_t:CDS:1 n=1 Tax=Funneliformis geosporum TaxID=1117311 RepID=A0A9W4SMZ1_9GLOM|nr:8182_t:CDS:2 [Funneliformis geosporum]CAI2192318.1 11913_t:CDS:2 [Funneliformis geosporum]
MANETDNSTNSGSIPLIHISSLEHFNGSLSRTIQSRSDGEGITGHFDSKNSSWKDFKDEYQGVSKGMFSPHNDGTILDGIMIDTAGGEIMLVDGKKALESLLMERPKLIEILMKPGCIYFCRDNQISLNCYVYSHMIQQHLRKIGHTEQ